MLRTTGTRRRGTSLVEVMIAAAMLMMGMWLLVWLYQQGMNAFLTAKAQAHLTSQERMVAAVMTADLSRAHFLEDESKPNRGRRVSDHDLRFPNYVPPRAGCFWARSRAHGGGLYPDPAFSSQYEATGDGGDSSRAVDHALQFTSLVPGGPEHLMFGAELRDSFGATNQWYGTAAEISYALVPGFRVTPNGTQLYDLVRRQRLAARTTDDLPVYQAVVNNALSDSPQDVMAVLGTQVQTLSDLTNPGRRLAQPINPQWRLAGRRTGEERLIGNVLSMEIKFTGPDTNLGAGAWQAADPSSRQWPRPYQATIAGAVSNSDYPYDFLPFNGEFDTYSRQLAYGAAQRATAANPGAPLKPIRITGVMVRIRVYNDQNKATRQTTFVVPL